MPDEQAKIDGDYQTVFGSEHGERVLRDLMRACCFWETSFDMTEPGLHSDPYKTTFNEGRRAVLLGILEHLRQKDMSLHEVAESYGQSMADYAVPAPAGSNV